MMNQYLILSGIVFLAGLLSLLGTRFLIRRAHEFGLIDIPNARSSHTQPTPRGGGLSFVVAFFIGSFALYLTGLVHFDWLLPIISGGTLVALIGWMDDRRSMSAVSRLLVHFSAAFLVYVLITRGFSVKLNVSFAPEAWPVITFLFSIFFVAWMINLYNFMDGIDGLAATNAVVTALCLAGTSAWQDKFPLMALYLLLAACVLGFLVFNWSPAKIFMGDSGSTFLGFSFAAIALTGKAMDRVAFVANVIVLGCFIVDATYTLLVRLLQGKQIYQAHRDHAFQHAIQLGWSHRRVVTFYSMITIFWLVPLALAALTYDRIAFLFLGIAYTPLIVMQVYFKAGQEGQIPKEDRLLRRLGGENSTPKSS